jgi:primosomal protein N' (replication factor Y) (superfamily II helicase)
MTGRLWRVVIPAPLRRAFVYEIPESLGDAAPGKRVLVPFGPRRITGYLLSSAEAPEGQAFSIKKALRILDEVPSIPGELIRFLEEAAAYYLHPLGEAARAALPRGIDVVEKQGVLIEPKIQAVRIKVARPALGAPEMEDRLSRLERRAPKRAAVLRRVLELGEAPLSSLRNVSKDAAALVRRLASDGLLSVEERDGSPDPFFTGPVVRDTPPELTDEQARAVAAIVRRIDQGGYEGFLLHGVTGSGKTEVYLRAVDRARGLGRGALVLVPEISLTPQLVHRYRARFGDDLAVWHSGLTDRERFDQWRLLRSGKVKVAVGVRSAVFAPVENLGIVIVDEEHDGSFKQDRGFHYNARDLALLRAARRGAVAVLGSATPALETLHNVALGKLARLELTTRATDQPLPPVEIIDLSVHRSGPAGQTVITMPLFAAMSNALERREQIILFLNRRGFSPALLCTQCGDLIKCRHCAVSMTYHKAPRKLVCHYCGAEQPVPERCQKCEAESLKPVGTGTQKAEEIVRSLFPDARVARLDRDTGAGKRAEAVLEQLRRQEVDILIGTQMVTKGHDFPNVTLVGVVSADTGLHMPDFRASERTFQLLTQVSGRAGRAELGGQAMIQTFNPHHHAVACAKTHDYHAFAETELAHRQELLYPPFGRLAALRLSGPDEDRVDAEARALFAELRHLAHQQRQQGLSLLGPTPAPMAYVQGRHRYRILIKAPRQDQIRRLLEPLIPKIEAPKKGVRITVDIDPYSML